MTVTTTVEPARRPRSCRSIPQRAMMWSPSINRRSYATTRSPSPSKARPISPGSVSPAIRPGTVAPQPSLMFRPSGAQATVRTEAPRRRSKSGAGAEAAPLAPSTTRRSPSSAPGRTVAPTPSRYVSSLAEASPAAAGGRPVGTATPRVAVMASCSPSVSLRPPGPEDLQAVVLVRIVRGRHHDARDAVGGAQERTAGVGATPSKSTSAPPRPRSRPSTRSPAESRGS